jgi:hypothetical protein
MKILLKMLFCGFLGKLFTGLKMVSKNSGEVTNINSCWENTNLSSYLPK